MQFSLSKVLLPGLALVALACSSDPTPPPETPASVDEPTPTEASSEKKEDDGSTSDIVISDRIKKACGLTDTEAHFAYDSAHLRESDKDIMRKIAECFTTGPLKGESMNLVGHADPRGENEYNMMLGEQRADTVGAALLDAGLPDEQLSLTSRGEIDAKGTDEASWAKDRRVDMLLAEEE